MGKQVCIYSIVCVIALHIARASTVTTKSVHMLKWHCAQAHLNHAHAQLELCACTCAYALLEMCTCSTEDVHSSTEVCMRPVIVCMLH